MTYKNLRALMKRMTQPADYTLKYCTVVIDGRSFFKDTYKKSGCQSLLGGEYDRYADYLKNYLRPFIENNVTCYVIFNGAMDATNDERTKIHQSIIDRMDNLKPDDEKAYCEPIFVKDVWREVLDELEIKYFVTEHDSWKTIFSVAEFFKCPVLTKNFEYTLRNISCISPDSLHFSEATKLIQCKIFKSISTSKRFNIKDSVLPLYFTLIDEQNLHFKRLLELVRCPNPKHLMSKVLTWAQGHNGYLKDTLETIESILTTEEWSKFIKAFDKNTELFTNTKDLLAINHFKREINEDIDYSDEFWFKKAVANGRIAVPYVNLIKNGSFSGSWLVFDQDQEDAMLPALDIVFYIKRFLDFKKDDSVVFIGRQKEKSTVRELHATWEDVAPKTESNLLIDFLNEAMPGFDMKILEVIPEECWILIVTLVYYCQKKMDLNFAYCVILSYIMLGPVSDKVGVIKRSKFMSSEERECNEIDSNGLKSEDCVTAIGSLMDLFYVTNVKKIFARKILHTFAEFQHCLQHMNYLNRLSGRKIKNTVYQKTINATFMYNMYLKLKSESSPTMYIEKCLKQSSVWDCFKSVESTFQNCLGSILPTKIGQIEHLQSVHFLRYVFDLNL